MEETNTRRVRRFDAPKGVVIAIAIFGMILGILAIIYSIDFFNLYGELNNYGENETLVLLTGICYVVDGIALFVGSILACARISLTPAKATRHALMVPTTWETLSAIALIMIATIYNKYNVESSAAIALYWIDVVIYAVSIIFNYIAISKLNKEDESWKKFALIGCIIFLVSAGIGFIGVMFSFQTLTFFIRLVILGLGILSVVLCAKSGFYITAIPVRNMGNAAEGVTTAYFSNGSTQTKPNYSKPSSNYGGHSPSSSTPSNNVNVATTNPAPTHSSTPKADELDRIEVLKAYKELLDAGVITQEDFDKKKKELLDSI